MKILKLSVPASSCQYRKLVTFVLAASVKRDHCLS